MKQIGLVERAQRAHAELNALVPVNELASLSPQLQQQAVQKLLDMAQMRWRDVDASLFPNGSLVGADFDNPGFFQAWEQLRTGMRERILAAALAWDGGDLAITGTGWEVKLHERAVVAILPRTYPMQRMIEIMSQVRTGWYTPPEGASWVRPGFLNPGEAPTITSLTEAAVWEIRSRVWYLASNKADMFPERDDAAASAARFENARRFLSLIVAEDWEKVIKNAYTSWGPQLQVQQAGGVQPRMDLADRVTHKIEDARTRQDASASQQFWDEQTATFDRRLAKKKNSGRTWGVELEITDAGKIMYPADLGWKRERDGSLRQGIGDGNVYDPWEFVSPILRKVYDPGLWMICDQAKDTVKFHRAGVHVHVGASDLTTGQVSRLIEIYALMSKLIDPIIQRRRNRTFCEPIHMDQWVDGWLPMTPNKRRPWRNHTMPVRHERAIDNARVWAEMTHGPDHDQPTHWKRHQELNLQSLNKYGTVEFRALGSVYDYAYITHWAWLCRAMVDYAASSRPVNPFYQVTTLAEAYALLAGAASERLSKLKGGR